MSLITASCAASRANASRSKRCGAASHEAGGRFYVKIMDEGEVKVAESEKK